MSETIRIKFTRTGPVSYIGHLDLLRYFQKIIAKSGIDIKYSQGFNPHQLVSFAYPLGVSMETHGDYMDMEVESYESTDAIVNSLNSVMNEGITVVSASVVPEGEPTAMASVYMADYDVFIDGTYDDNEIKDYLSQKEILIIKDSKKGQVESDIRPGIKELRIEGDKLFMKLSSGSSLNVKPASVVDTLNAFTGKNREINLIRRLEIYKGNENGIKPLGEF
jgi:radical SAM-linked protein